MLCSDVCWEVSREYWRWYNKEEGEGLFFHNGNICTLNRILGLLTWDFSTCLPNLFPKAHSNQPLGKRSPWWQTTSAISKTDDKWDRAEWHWSCSYPWAHCHGSQCICQSMSLSHPQEKRYSTYLFPAQTTTGSHWDLQIALPSYDAHSEDVDKSTRPIPFFVKCFTCFQDITAMDTL